MSILPFLVLPDGLHPVSPEGEALLVAKHGQVVRADVLTPKRLKTRQQEEYWHGVVCKAIAACWKHQQEWAVEPDKSVVHDVFMRTVFGQVETPLGPGRRTSTTLTLEEYSTLIDAGREYLWDKFKVQIDGDQVGVTL